MTVHIDTHESLAIGKHLSKFGVPSEQKHQLGADEQIGDWGFERKSMSDYLASCRSINGQPPRLWNQLYRLKQSFGNRAILAVTGTPEDIIRRGHQFDYSRFMAYRARSLFGGLHIPTMLFKDDEEFAYFLAKGHDILGSPTVRPVPFTHSKAPDNVVVENMLCQIKGVGIKTARKIIREVANSIAKLSQMSEEQLVSVLGNVGKNVYRFLHVEIKYKEGKDGSKA